MLICYHNQLRLPQNDLVYLAFLFALHETVAEIELLSDFDDDEEDIDVRPGDGLVVPKGKWHRVDIIEPSQIVYLTPGPNNQFRPVPSDA